MSISQRSSSNRV